MTAASKLVGVTNDNVPSYRLTIVFHIIKVSIAFAKKIPAEKSIIQGRNLLKKLMKNKNNYKRRGKNWTNLEKFGIIWYNFRIPSK